MKTMVAVIGAGQCDDQTGSLAYEVGKEIALRGYGLVCGGLGGVMEAACEGCRQQGGLTVGIIPQAEKEAANRFVDIVIPTGMGIARNMLVVRSAAGVIAVGGRYGTLSEIAFALQLGIPLVGINTWELGDIIRAGSAQQALDKLEQVWKVK